LIYGLDFLNNLHCIVKVFLLIITHLIKQFQQFQYSDCKVSARLVRHGLLTWTVLSNLKTKQTFDDSKTDICLPAFV